MSMYCKFYNEWNFFFILCRLEYYVLYCCFCCGICLEYILYSDFLIFFIEIGIDFFILEKGIREI